MLDYGTRETVTGIGDLLHPPTLLRSLSPVTKLV
jgi:hypothetical protein